MLSVLHFPLPLWKQCREGCSWMTSLCTYAWALWIIGLFCILFCSKNIRSNKIWRNIHIKTRRSLQSRVAGHDHFWNIGLHSLKRKISARKEVWLRCLINIHIYPFSTLFAEEKRARKLGSISRLSHLHSECICRLKFCSLAMESVIRHE